MTPEQWVHGLDLPNLMRYGTIDQARGLIATAIREAVAAERAACAKLADDLAEHAERSCHDDTASVRLTAQGRRGSARELATVIRARE